MAGILDCLPIAVLSARLAAAAGAEERIAVDLVQTGVANSTRYQGRRTDTTSSWPFRCGRRLNRPNGGPLPGLAGRCFGTTEYQRDLIVAGGGYCAYRDLDGDALVIRWAPREQSPVGRTTGVWEVNFGDGKWAGASGGGGLETMRNGKAGDQIRKLTGEIVLP